jgi:hypothetical protein
MTDNSALSSDAPGSDRVTITAARADCRARPSRSAKRIARLASGDEVTMLDRQRSWVRVRSTGGDCWITQTALESAVETAAPAAESTTELTPPPRLVSVPRPNTRHYTRRHRGYDTGGACPCGSGRICIGPRGGRYCITSGGNKEYGQ